MLLAIRAASAALMDLSPSSSPCDERFDRFWGDRACASERRLVRRDDNEDVCVGCCCDDEALDDVLDRCFRFLGGMISVSYL